MLGAIKAQIVKLVDGAVVLSPKSALFELRLLLAVSCDKSNTPGQTE